MTRRHLLTALASSPLLAAKRPTIVLRSGWQTVNIGDVAHTPGALAALERSFPNADLVLWAVSMDETKEALLKRRFPRLRIVRGAFGADGKPDSPELREAVAVGDVLIHGSAASAAGRHKEFAAWRAATGKPYGFFGVGVPVESEAAAGGLNAEAKELFTRAAFVFTRETDSLKNLQAAGIRGPALGFAPDGTFSMDVIDAPRAEQFLRDNKLERGRFACFIPRLRYTPYHLIRKVDWSPEETRRRVTVNEQQAGPDHAKMREAIVAWVRQTGGQALLCPEMTYQLDVIGPRLYDPLPDDVKRRTVRRTTFWGPDEAAGVYRHAAAVVSMECHSPILAVTQGTPCMYLHQPEDGIKGRMWPDVGLADWYFEIASSTGEQIAARLLAIGKDLPGARRTAQGAHARARKQQDDSLGRVRNVLGG